MVENALPDKMTILKVLLLLERYQLVLAFLDGTAAMLAAQGLLRWRGNLVDATFIAAPPSAKKRAPTQTRDFRVQEV